MSLPTVDVSTLHRLLPLAAVLLGSLGLGLLARWVLLRLLRRWARHTVNAVDDMVLGAVRGPSLAWVVALAVDLTLRASPLGPEGADYARRWLLVVLIGSVTVFFGSLAAGGLRLAAERAGETHAATGIGRAVVQVVVGLVGATLLLRAVGIEVGPLLTALGVGGLAFALALQESLGNFFAGLHILLEHPFRVGHFVQLEGGHAGVVVDISWRTTRIRTDMDQVIVVPNSKIAGATLVNYHFPDPRVRIEVEIPVDLAADVDTVRRVFLDEAARVITAPPFLAEPPPDVWLNRLSEYAYVYKVRVHIGDWRERHPAWDVLHRALVTRIRAEGIVIPYPVRTVLLDRAARGEEAACGS